MANQSTTEKRKPFSFVMNTTEKQMLITICKTNYSDYSEQIRKLIRDEYNRVIERKEQNRSLTAVTPESR